MYLKLGVTVESLDKDNQFFHHHILLSYGCNSSNNTRVCFFSFIAKNNIISFKGIFEMNRLFYLLDHDGGFLSRRRLFAGTTEKRKKNF